MEKGRFQKLLFSVKNVLKRHAFSDRFRWIRVDRKLLPKNEIKKKRYRKKISHIKSTLCFKFIYMNIGMSNIGVPQ